jgi:hypothetical protein
MTKKYMEALNSIGNTLISHGGETKTMLEWARDRGICLSTFRNWLKKGKAMQDIMTKPWERVKRFASLPRPKIPHREFNQIDVLKDLEKWYSQPITQGGIENA